MNESLDSATRRQITPTDWLAPLLALTLMALLLPVATMRLASSQPWRAEMLTSLFLFVSILIIYIRDREYAARLFALDKRIGSIVVLLAGFTIWGLLSTSWARSADSAWHHTLVWTEYILFFLFVRENLSRTRNVRFVTGIFLWLCGIIGILCLIDYATLPDFKSLEGTLRARYSVGKTPVRTVSSPFNVRAGIRWN